MKCDLAATFLDILMGEIHEPSPVLLMLSAFSAHPEALDWAEQQAVAHWGPLALRSDRFEFVETDYYEASMGPQLKKTFLAFAALVDPAELTQIKRQTNQWEADYAQLGQHDLPRPLNLDPGYLTLAKLVLASTKDHAHRIYLSEGIYAEITLVYRAKRWQAREWTFPDYRREDYQAFFSQAREYLHNRREHLG